VSKTYIFYECTVKYQTKGAAYLRATKLSWLPFTVTLWRGFS